MSKEKSKGKSIRNRVVIPDPDPVFLQSDPNLIWAGWFFEDRIWFFTVWSGTGLFFEGGSGFLRFDPDQILFPKVVSGIFQGLDQYLFIILRKNYRSFCVHLIFILCYIAGDSLLLYRSIIICVILFYNIQYMYIFHNAVISICVFVY